MNKTLLFSFFLCINLLLVNGQTTCNTEGNVVVFSNYDGGILNINVDQNIPNLKIGICSYEAVDIRITGTYASNVTAVIYAGFNDSNEICFPLVLVCNEYLLPLLTKIKRLQRGLLRQTTITAQPLRCKTLYYPARNFYSCYLNNLFHEKRFLTQQDYNVCSLHVVPFFLNCLI
jgi:hypothetical protein